VTASTLWYLADQATRRAEAAYYRLRDDYTGFLEWNRSRRVSRSYFRTLADRTRQSGAPFGAHTVVRHDDRLLLVRHDGVDQWVVPGGEVEPGESYREAAERELAEEAGIEATYDGLAMTTRFDIAYDDHSMWGVLPVFAAVAPRSEPTVDDPDGEISDARWFRVDDLPPDTRNRDELLAWYDQCAKL
jgi:8-oxo-dGTP diphosphatase